MPARPSAPLALLAATTLALTLASAPAATAAPTATDTSDRILLSPTATPDTARTFTWRSAGTSTPTAQIAPAAAPDDVRAVSGTTTATLSGRTHHAATATGLTPDTDYRYRVGDGTTFGPWHTFTTTADEADPFTFLYFGDIQNNITAGAAPVVRAALAAEPDADLAVHVGDLVDSANSDSQWSEWFAAFGPRATGGMDHLATPGNHEYSALSLSSRWAPQFPTSGNGPTSGRDLSRTAHYTDYNGVRFVVLNSNHRNAAPLSASSWLNTQQRWLDRVLTDNPHTWTVVLFHHPLFSNSPSRDNGRLRTAWLDTLEEHDVDLVLQGHDHSYGRGNLTAHRTDDPDVHTGPVYAVTVTGPKMYDIDPGNWTDNGAEVRVQFEDTQTYQTVDVDGGVLVYTARTADGTVVDSFTIDKDGDDKRVTDTR
ncbi:metallophosphoesterase family protein [Nocardiopsis sp. N85]|uniref:purple acid phosphatase family protein n=1 Tax=Nocardiopsis sp. N85 TaxID=3029400 RepID=UPI00237FA5F2|nr:metallophosphoesterase family protein [Nocardiopsis sp. N85]MDE3724192.1 metallophosphoesterase family protein [Nocardiopsis sp. N85]